MAGLLQITNNGPLTFIIFLAGLAVAALIIAARNKSKAPLSNPAAEPAANEEPVYQADNSTFIADDTDSIDNDELIAVISAAIAAYQNTTTHSVIVRSVRRNPNNRPVWNHAGRYDQISSRL